MNELQIAKEVFLSILKWVIASNVVTAIIVSLIWGAVLYNILNGNTADIKQTQDGINNYNYQEMKNG